jgi:ribosomal protein S18 acetylase RimI-like enzyme
VQTEVRPARADDVDALRWLEQEARTDVATRRGGMQLLAEQPVLGDGWAELVDATPPRVLVATIDGVAVGYLLLGPVAVAATARVEQVWVSPGAREVGFGDDLLATATGIARQGGAVAIEAEALPGDRETKNLYERAGVTARKLVVWKALDPEGT